MVTFVGVWNMTYIAIDHTWSLEIILYIVLLTGTLAIQVLCEVNCVGDSPYF